MVYSLYVYAPGKTKSGECESHLDTLARSWQEWQNRTGRDISEAVLLIESYLIGCRIPAMRPHMYTTFKLAIQDNVLPARTNVLDDGGINSETAGFWTEDSV